ncbi:MAG: hypothetical protein ACRD93_05260, partial [Nitrososphaeraceae archaeon]
MGPNNITCVVRTIAAHPTNPRVLYAGAPGGIWKTPDGGQTWIPILDTELNLNVECLEIFRNSPNIIYAGMNNNDLGEDIDIFRSNDSGSIWIRMTKIPSRSSHAIAINPTNPDVVYVAGDQSLHKSTDGGKSWIIHQTRIDGVIKFNFKGIFDGNIDDIKIDPDFPDTLYLAVRNRGLYRTVDGGDKWDTLGDSVTFSVRNDSGAEQTTSLNGNFRILLAVGTDRRTGKHGTAFLVAKVQGTILTSLNRGTAWRILPGVDHGHDDQNWWDSCLAVCPSDEDFIVAGGNDIDFTLNASDPDPVWRDIPNSFHVDQQSIAFTPSNPDDFYFSNDGCIAKVTNRGTASKKISDGLTASQCFNVSVSETANPVIGCTTYHTGTIISDFIGFANWREIDGPEGGLFEIDPMNEKTIFNSPWGQAKLHRSRDGGATWENISVTIDDAGVTRETYIQIIAIRPDDSRKIYASGFFGRLHYSTDGGDTWDYIRKFDGSPLLIDGGTGRGNAASCFAYSPSAKNYLFMGTKSGLLWLTRRAGTTAESWEQLNPPNIFRGTSTGTNLNSEKYIIPATDARYVRVLVNGNTQNNWASITELDVYGTSSIDSCTVNISIVGVTASGNDGNLPSNVLDNNLGTRWSSFGIGQYITVELGSTQNICSVDIAWYKG